MPLCLCRRVGEMVLKQTWTATEHGASIYLREMHLGLSSQLGDLGPPDLGLPSLIRVDSTGGSAHGREEVEVNPA